MKKLVLSHNPTLKSSFKKILEAYRSLLIVFKVILEEIYSINKKKFKIGHPIFNTFYLFYQSLILSGSVMS